MKLPPRESQGVDHVVSVNERYQIAESEPRAKRNVVGGVEKDVVARRWDILCLYRLRGGIGILEK